jgi:hypothetical protein
MTSDAMIEIRSARVADASPISALLCANSAEHGGALLGDWSVGVVTAWIESGSLVIVAADGPRLAGVLFTEEKARATAPPVIAMLRAWDGGTTAYVYGPVCIDQRSRGLGVLEALYAAVMARMSGREAVLFVRRSNTRSLRAHARLGMAEVAQFTFGDEEFLVLSSAHPLGISSETEQMPRS